MTGDETENVPDPTTDAAESAPAPSDAPLALTPAEEAVPDFDVPEPPTFDESGDLPVPDAVTAEPVIPPPPVFEDEQDAAASDSREDARPITRRAAQRAQTAAPVAPAESYVDDAPHAPPGTVVGTNYRGWTIAICAGLAVLFLGAIGFMAFLGLSG